MLPSGWESQITPSTDDIDWVRRDFRAQSFFWWQIHLTNEELTSLIVIHVSETIVSGNTSKKFEFFASKASTKTARVLTCNVNKFQLIPSDESASWKSKATFTTHKKESKRAKARTQWRKIKTTSFQSGEFVSFYVTEQEGRLLPSFAVSSPSYRAMKNPLKRTKKLQTEFILQHVGGMRVNWIDRTASKKALRKKRINYTRRPRLTLFLSFRFSFQLHIAGQKRISHRVSQLNPQRWLISPVSSVFRSFMRLSWLLVFGREGRRRKAMTRRRRLCWPAAPLAFLSASLPWPVSVCAQKPELLSSTNKQTNTLECSYQPQTDRSPVCSDFSSWLVSLWLSSFWCPFPP